MLAGCGGKSQPAGETETGASESIENEATVLYEERDGERDGEHDSDADGEELDEVDEDDGRSPAERWQRRDELNRMRQQLVQEMNDPAKSPEEREQLRVIIEMLDSGEID